MPFRLGPTFSPRRPVIWIALAMLAGGIMLDKYSNQPASQRPAARVTEGEPIIAVEIEAQRREARAFADVAARAEAQNQAYAQQVAEAERARLSREEADKNRREIDDTLREYNQLLAGLRARIIPVKTTLGTSQRDTAEKARRVDFDAFRLKVITPEEASSPAACSDPATTWDLVDRTRRRDRNILACAVYYAQHQGEELRVHPSDPTGITLALALRIHTAGGIGAFPLPGIFAYVWQAYLNNCFETGTIPDALPPLTAEDGYNPALFRAALPPSFARRLIETAITEEKLELANTTYPAIRRLVEVGTRLAKTCQKIGKDECRKALYL